MKNIIESLIKNKYYEKIESYLSIYDIERLQRRIDMNTLHPFELNQLMVSFYQIENLVNFIKTNIQQYLATVGATPQGTIPGVSASSLGNKDMPLNINVNLGSGSSSKSAFDNITGTTTSTDLLSLLDKYETSQTIPANERLFSGSDLATALQTNQGCTSLNLGDYTSNRVSTCNCKL